MKKFFIRFVLLLMTYCQAQSPGENTILPRKVDTVCEKYSQLEFQYSSIYVLASIYPWVVALGYENSSSLDVTYRCGGTIISENFILTAAQCVSNGNLPRYALIGEYILPKTIFENDKLISSIHKIKEIIKHPDYVAETFKNDIALVRVSRPIQFAANIRPACLRTDLSDLPTSESLSITGWGKTERVSSTMVLQKAYVKTMNLTTCKKMLSETDREENRIVIRDDLSANQYCAYDVLQDVCDGDYGGPLQSYEYGSATATIVGVISFTSCGTGPSVYTRVASFVDWIEKIVWPN